MAKFKTMRERRSFLDDYKDWKCFHTVPELDLKFYVSELSTGAKIIATQYPYRDYDLNFGYLVNYCLILHKNDIFPNSHFYGFYKPAGCGITTVLEYLKLHKDCEVI